MSKKRNWYVEIDWVGVVIILFVLGFFATFLFQILGSNSAINECIRRGGNPATKGILFSECKH